MRYGAKSVLTGDGKICMICRTGPGKVGAWHEYDAKVKEERAKMAKDLLEEINQEKSQHMFLEDQWDESQIPLPLSPRTPPTPRAGQVIPSQMATKDFLPALPWPGDFIADLVSDEPQDSNQGLPPWSDSPEVQWSNGSDADGDWVIASSVSSDI